MITSRISIIRVCWFILSVTSCSALSCSELTNSDVTQFEKPLLGNFSQLLKCKGVSGLLAPHYIWRPLSLQIDCGRLQSFSVYIGPSPDALQQRFLNGEQAWCSLSSLFQPGCELQISPFKTSYVGIRKLVSTGTSCRFNVDAPWSSWMMGSCVVGLVVYLWAAPLSESIGLRVTSGALLFAMGSVLILMYILAKQMPGRRSAVTAYMVFGSSTWGLLRWLTGRWVPSVNALLHNPWLLAWLVCSGFVGAGVTYLYGGVENPKVNTLIFVGLRLLGVVLLYSGTWTEPVAFTTLAALALTMPVVQYFSSVVSWWRTRGRLPSGQAAGVAGENKPPATPLGSDAAIRTPRSQAGGPPLSPCGTLTGPAPSFTSPAPYTPVQRQHFGQLQTAPDNGPCISPLIMAGMIKDPLTNVNIDIGGDRYQELTKAGFIPEDATGRFLPPVDTPGSVSSAQSYDARQRRNMYHW